MSICRHLFETNKVFSQMQCHEFQLLKFEHGIYDFYENFYLRLSLSVW